MGAVGEKSRLLVCSWYLYVRAEQKVGMETDAHTDVPRCCAYAISKLNK